MDHNMPRSLPIRPAASAPQMMEGRRTIVTPFARALTVLSAFTTLDKWLCNSDLAKRTQLPASTVIRMTRTLVALGYLRSAADQKRFCLSPSALALGYRAAADTEIDRAANQRMSLFAERHQVHVNMCARDRLDLVVIDSCRTNAFPASLQLGIGTRMELASSAAGWALLAGLPDAERNYLLRNAENQPRCELGQIRMQSSEAIKQVREDGFCVALGKSGQPMTMVAAPIQLSNHSTLALSCVGPATLMGRARSVRELGPALVRMAQEIQLCSERP